MLVIIDAAIDAKSTVDPTAVKLFMFIQAKLLKNVEHNDTQFTAIWQMIGIRIFPDFSYTRHKTRPEKNANINCGIFP